MSSLQKYARKNGENITTPFRVRRSSAYTFKKGNVAKYYQNILLVMAVLRPRIDRRQKRTYIPGFQCIFIRHVCLF